MKEAGIEIKEMNSGCICCSLVGDFGTSLKEVIETYAPERILIEPSGVGKLSDVIKAVEDVKTEAKVLLNSAVVVVDAGKCKMYIKNFGEFFLNQIEHAGTIVLSRTGGMNEDKLKLVVDMIREHNKDAKIITTPWDELDSKIIIEAMEGKTKSLAEELMEETLHHHHHEDGECCHGHHHDHEHEHEHHHEDGECCHGHHDHEDGECCHGHHHHEDGECCHGHHHDHDHEHEHHHKDGECCHGHHHDHDHEHHHHHHHADEVFSSWGKETPAHYTKEQIEKILAKLDSGEYGMILRAKGMVPCDNGTWIYFDYVPGEMNVREGKADYTGKLCVIGSKLKEKEIEELFA